MWVGGEQTFKGTHRLMWAATAATVGRPIGSVALNSGTCPVAQRRGGGGAGSACPDVSYGLRATL